MYINLAKTAWDILNSMGIFLIVVAILLNFFNIFLYSLRWKIVLKELGEKVKFLDLLKITTSSMFINNITPMSKSGGEIIKILWLNKKCKVSGKKSTISVIYDRLTEILPLTVLAIISLFYVVSEMTVVSTIFISVLLFIWLFWEDVIIYVSKLLDLEITKDELEKINQLRKKIVFNIKVFTVSFLIWFFEVLRFYLILAAFDVNLSIGTICTITLGNVSLGLISFTPGGIGIVDGGLVGIFTYFGVPLKLSIILTFVERFISYGLNSVVGFFVMSISGGFEIWKRTKSR